MPKRPVRRLLARALLAITGWKPDGVRPEPKLFVLIAAPHTTNWDFVYLIAFAAYFEVEISWMGKASLFRRPFGGFMRALGGVPVQRRKRENLVDAMAKAFSDRQELGLVVSAEGTRDYVEYWKSGFYHIAVTARVPIVMSYLDYSTKRGGFGPAFHPTGNLSQDMDAVRAFYEGRKGKFPELFGRIRLLEEDAGILETEPQAAQS
jgi:1-acyl-sn-glycerol-3-phosphate acyltransferase